jgi:hypothetical protein
VLEQEQLLLAQGLVPVLEPVPGPQWHHRNQRLP